MMFTVEISVVIPCFNVGEYIEECLECVLNQILLPVEIICVDDNSTDNTWQVMTAIAEKHPKLITLMKNKGKKGAPGSRNTGLSVCKGNYVQFLDADDIIFPTKFSHQAKLLLEGQCKTDILVGSFSKKFINGQEKVYVNKTVDPWVALIDNKIGVTTANLFKKSKLDEVDGWSSELKSSQEYELMFKMMKKNALVQFDEVLISYNRERAAGSISKTNPKEKWKRYMDLRVEIFKFLQSSNQLTEDRESTFYNNIFNASRSLYRYDKSSSKDYIKQYLKEKKLPIHNQPINAVYAFLYNTFGFNIAQVFSRVLSTRKSLES